MEHKPFDKLINWYFSKNALPYWCIIMIDCASLIVSGLLVYWMMTSSDTLYHDAHRVINSLICAVILSIPGCRIFHTYSGYMRFSGFVDLMRVAYSNLLSLGLVLLAQCGVHLLPSEWFVHFKLSVIIMIYLLATLLMWSARVLVRTLYVVAFSQTRAKRILIYGAMQGGVGLAKAIRDQRPRKYVVKGFISHAKLTERKEILGEPVYSVDADLAEIIRKSDIDAVLVASNRVKEFRNCQKLQDEIIGAGAKILMMQDAIEDDGSNPSEEGTASVNHQIREVTVEELLPRMEIRVDLKSVEELLKGKRVLITGSAGSIGSEMVNQVAQFGPAAMMLIDQAETPEHDIRLMMNSKYPDVPTETIVTSICNQRRMEDIFKRFKPDYVFHAAAYKHVPMMENNPSEAVQNNIYGTKVIADLSVKYGVKKFVMVSTDKAVNPTNVMGCSKRICEIYVQSLDRKLKLDYMQQPNRDRSAVKTQFVTTRFGNVLGSNGSVIPLFRKQIQEGGPVTVTDENIVRFFMLIPEACKLVLEAGTKGNGGEIFVFDMGKPVRISDLAKRMIKLSGVKNVEIKYTGLRPGEKLYEEVLNDQENTKPTFHEKIRIAEVREYDYDQVCKEIDELVDIAKQFDDMATVKKMKDIVPEYKSNNSVYEKLDGKE